jgi:hypothetical protein
MKPGIVVQSVHGASSTRIDAGERGRVFECVDLSEKSVIEGFTIKGGHADEGAGIRCLNSVLDITECEIELCEAAYGGGIYASESDVTVDGCRISNCYGGGIYGGYGRLTVRNSALEDNTAGSGGGVWASHAEMVSLLECTIARNVANWGIGGGIIAVAYKAEIKDCLVVDNIAAVWGGGQGIVMGTVEGLISGCTIAHQRRWNADDPTLWITSGTNRIERTIIAFNEGVALYCESDASIRMTCCDVFGNTVSDELCGEDGGGNFSADPLFCGADNGDYRLFMGSPCLPGNHPDGVDCGLIGALGQGCGPTPVLEMTWGRIKGLFQYR